MNQMILKKNKTINFTKLNSFSLMQESISWKRDLINCPTTMSSVKLYVTKLMKCYVYVQRVHTVL